MYGSQSRDVQTMMKGMGSKRLLDNSLKNKRASHQGIRLPHQPIAKKGNSPKRIAANYRAQEQSIIENDSLGGGNDGGIVFI